MSSQNSASRPSKSTPAASCPPMDSAGAPQSRHSIIGVFDVGNDIVELIAGASTGVLSLDPLEQSDDADREGYGYHEVEQEFHRSSAHHIAGVPGLALNGVVPSLQEKG